MRVLFVVHQYPPHAGAGVERYTETLARRLAGRGECGGVFTRVLGPVPREPKLERDDDDGVRVYRAVGGAVSLDDPTLHDRRLERLWTIALVESAADVVHVNHVAGMPLGLVEAALRLRVAVVVTLHDHFFACPLAYLRKRSAEQCEGPDDGRECARTCFEAQPRALERWQLRAEYFRELLASATRIVCGSTQVARYFEAFEPRALPIAVLPLGIRDEVVAVLPDGPRAQGPLRLAYVGAVAEHKGVHVVIDAAATAGVDVELRVLGQPYSAEYVAELERRAAAAPTVALRLHGPYRDQDLGSLLAGADAVVVPSQVREVYPFAPREALANGIPVLAGRLGGLPEAVEDEVNGLTFDSTNAADLAALLRRLRDDASLLERLRHGARATSVTTLDDHVAAMRNLYADAITAAEHDGSLEITARLDRLHRRLLAAFAG